MTAQKTEGWINKLTPTWIGEHRPYLSENGHSRIKIAGTRFWKRRPAPDNSAIFTEAEWASLDAAVKRAAGQRMPLVSRLVAEKESGLCVSMEDMKRRQQESRLEEELRREEEEAGGAKLLVMDDGTRTDTIDTTYLSGSYTPGQLTFQLGGLPLPYTYDDWVIPEEALACELACSRNRGTTPSFDITWAETLGRRVGDALERILIHGWQAPEHDPPVQLRGLLTNSLSMTFTGNLTNGKDILHTTLEIRNRLYEQRFYGPFWALHSIDLDPYLDNDYQLHGSTPLQSVRDRLGSIADVVRPVRIDGLPEGTFLLMQATPDVVRMVQPVEPVLVQMNAPKGGTGGVIIMRYITVTVPQIRADLHGNVGVGYWRKN